MKKKILYINKQYRTYDEIKYSLLKNNFDLHIIWINDFRKDEIPQSFILKDLYYYIIDLHKTRLKPWHIKSNLKLIYILLRIKDVDLIISSTSDSWHSKVAFLIARFKKIPISFRKEIWFYPETKNFITSFNRSLTKLIERNAKCIFIPGIKQKELILRNHRNYNIKLYPFPYLINDKKFKREAFLSSDIVSFVYWGRIIPLKGIINLIEVSKKLFLQGFTHQVIIIGGETNRTYQNISSKGYYEECVSLVSETTHIKYFGTIKNNLIRNYIPNNSVFVMPNVKYVNNELIGDGWGNALVEATALGLPIISSDRVGSAFMLVESGKNGFILNSEDLLQELIDKMQYFIENSYIIEKFGSHSREKFEQINNPEIMINSINEML